MKNLYRYLPDKLEEYIRCYSEAENITEIHMYADSCITFSVSGKIIKTDILLSHKEMEDVFYNMCDKSINAYEDEIAKGFITLKGGYRVGIGGEYYYSKISEKYLIRNILSLNIRIPHNFLYFENQHILFETEPVGTLIIGKPHSGKTSLIKLYLKFLSGQYRICICDERRELYQKGIICDVLSGIDKATAISMATRTLNPQFIVCDEIGIKAESENILSSVNTGVEFICSAHGETIQQVLRRPNIKLLAGSGVFKRFVLLENNNENFCIKEIKNV